jgi:2'-5' RNA ligase
MSDSAFLIRVAEAEPRVGALRDRFDPSARLGVPAHITLLYPFMSAELVSNGVLSDVRGIATSMPEFSFALKQVRRFPGYVYLAPEPVVPFIALIDALARAFPDYPLYRGQYPAIVPHLTVARVDEPEQSRIETELVQSLAGSTGISARCREMTLMENSSGRWQVMQVFPLGDTAEMYTGASR